MAMNTNPNLTYTSPTGRPYKVIQVGKIPDSSKFVNKIEYFLWFTIIRFTDDAGGKMKLFYNYNEKIIKKEVVV